MSAPPSDIEPSALFAKLLEMPSPSEVIDFPRRDANGNWVGKVRIMVLPQSQYDRARIAANTTLKQKRLDEEQKSVTVREVAGDEVAKELIAMATVTAEPQGEDENGHPIYGRIFRTARDVEKLTADEVAALFNAHLLVQAKFGPYEGDPDTELWVKRLMEGGSGFPLLSLRLPDVVQVACCFAERIYSMSRTLESQWSTLPESCQSALSKYNIGTGFWSSHLDDSDLGITERSPDIDVDDATELSRTTRAIEDMNRALDE